LPRVVVVLLVDVPVLLIVLSGEPSEPPSLRGRHPREHLFGGHLEVVIGQAARRPCVKRTGFLVADHVLRRALVVPFQEVVNVVLGSVRGKLLTNTHRSSFVDFVLVRSVMPCRRRTETGRRIRTR